MDSSFTYCVVWEGTRYVCQVQRGCFFTPSPLVIDAQAKAKFHDFSLEPIPFPVYHGSSLWTQLPCGERLRSSMFFSSLCSFFSLYLYCAVPFSFPTSVHLWDPPLVYLLLAVPTHQLSFVILIVYGSALLNNIKCVCHLSPGWNKGQCWHIREQLRFWWNQSYQVPKVKVGPFGWLRLPYLSSACLCTTQPKYEPCPQGHVSLVS